jgi:hypothetical protein
VTEDNPEDQMMQGNYISISLADLNDVQLNSLLGTLIDQILVTGLNNDNLRSQQYWLSWMNVVENAVAKVSSILEGSTIDIKTKFASISIKS